MSKRNGKLTDKQLKILRALIEIPGNALDPVKPVELGMRYGKRYDLAPKWACSGLKWLVYYGLAKKLGRGSYRITSAGLYYLQHLA